MWGTCYYRIWSPFRWWKSKGWKGPFPARQILCRRLVLPRTYHGPGWLAQVIPGQTKEGPVEQHLPHHLHSWSHWRSTNGVYWSPPRMDQRPLGKPPRWPRQTSWSQDLKGWSKNDKLYFHFTEFCTFAKLEMMLCLQKGITQIPLQKGKKTIKRCKHPLQISSRTLIL